MKNPAGLGSLMPIALALGSIGAPPAAAQEPPPADGARMILEEMVVTARRREEGLLIIALLGGILAVGSDAVFVLGERAPWAWMA